MREDAYQTVPLADLNNVRSISEKEIRFKEFAEKVRLKKES